MVFRGPNDKWSAVFTSDPANVVYILKTKFASFPKGPTFRSSFRDFLGECVRAGGGQAAAVSLQQSVFTVLFLQSIELLAEWYPSFGKSYGFYHRVESDEEKQPRLRYSR